MELLQSQVQTKETQTAENEKPVCCKPDFSSGRLTIAKGSDGRHKGKHVLGHPGTGSTKEIHSIRDEREYWHNENIEMSPKT